MPSTVFTQKDLIGSFVFTLQDHGILQGLYNNTLQEKPFPESAQRRPESSSAKKSNQDIFTGIYDTIWLEVDGVEATYLEIRPAKNAGTYYLFWRDDEKEYFRGLAFVRGNDLVGAYWHEEIKKGS